MSSLTHSQAAPSKLLVASLLVTAVGGAPRQALGQAAEISTAARPLGPGPLHGLLAPDLVGAHGVAGPTGKQRLAVPVRPRVLSPEPQLRGLAAVAPGAGGLSGRTVSAPAALYPVSFMIMMTVVCILYGRRGPRVVLSVLSYLVALSTMKLSVKWVLVHHNFHFAKLVSSAHFLAGALTCFGILLSRKWQWGVPMPIPTRRVFFMMICPISLATAFSIGANNMALVFCSTAFAEIIGSTGCLITVATVVLMGMPFDKWLTLPTLMVAVGCMVSTVGEMNFSGLGMFLCIASNIFRSVKVTLQQRLMTQQAEEALDPCALLFWISIPSTLVMLTASLMTEGVEPYGNLSKMDFVSLKGLVSSILLSCVNAVALNVAQLFVTKDLGAVGSQLIAQSKMVLTILGGMAVFDEPVTYLQAVGFVTVLIGVFLFSRMEMLGKEREAQKMLLSAGGLAAKRQKA